MPGVDETSVDITLEKNVLTISGYVEPMQPEGYSLARVEYNIGDFERAFTLSDKIDRDGIGATPWLPASSAVFSCPNDLLDAATGMGLLGCSGQAAHPGSIYGCCIVA